MGWVTTSKSDKKFTLNARVREEVESTGDLVDIHSIASDNRIMLEFVINAFTRLISLVLSAVMVVGIRFILLKLWLNIIQHF